MCSQFRGCLTIEVNGESIGALVSVSYIVGALVSVRYSYSYIVGALVSVRYSYIVGVCRSGVQGWPLSGVPLY